MNNDRSTVICNSDAATDPKALDLQHIRECTEMDSAAYLRWLNDTTTTRASGIKVTPVSKLNHYWNVLKVKFRSALVKPTTSQWNGAHGEFKQWWKTR